MIDIQWELAMALFAEHKQRTGHDTQSAAHPELLWSRCDACMYLDNAMKKLADDYNAGAPQPEPAR